MKSLKIYCCLTAILIYFSVQKIIPNCLALDDTGYIMTRYAGTGTMSAGNDGAPATQAGIAQPLAIWQDSNGNLYVTDGDNFIRKIDETSSIITVFIGQPGNGWNGDGLPSTSTQLNGAGGRFSEVMLFH